MVDFTFRKKALRETQTLRTGCSKVEPKFLPLLYIAGTMQMEDWNTTEQITRLEKRRRAPTAFRPVLLFFQPCSFWSTVVLQFRRPHLPAPRLVHPSVKHPVCAVFGRRRRWRPCLSVRLVFLFAGCWPHCARTLARSSLQTVSESFAAAERGLPLLMQPQSLFFSESLVPFNPHITQPSPRTAEPVSTLHRPGPQPTDRVCL